MGRSVFSRESKLEALKLVKEPGIEGLGSAGSGDSHERASVSIQPLHGDATWR